MSKSCADPALPEESRHADCMARIAQGEHAALGELYDATLGKVYGFALRLTGKPESAEEVVGDVFLQTWRQAERFDATRGSVMAWLMMLTRSRALDLLRRVDQAESHPDPDTLVAEVEGTGGRPVELLLETERRSGMNEALQHLSPVQRQLIALAFFRDLSHQEIADHTQLPLGTVKSHIRRALEKLRPLLEQHRHD
jgi:RNA polymerase sigma-70 factor (ECF subfamily)